MIKIFLQLKTNEVCKIEITCLFKLIIHDIQIMQKYSKYKLNSTWHE